MPIFCHIYALLSNNEVSVCASNPRDAKIRVHAALNTQFQFFFYYSIFMMSERGDVPNIVI